MPLITYRPPPARGAKKTSAQDRRRLEEEFSELGLGDKDITALQTLATSDRIDYEVRMLRYTVCYSDRMHCSSSNQSLNILWILQ